MIEKKITTANTVIAITRDDNRLKAACLSRKAEQVEILWTKESQPGQEDWALFAEQSSLSAQPSQERRASASAHNRSVIVGFDSPGVVFYHFDMPAVRQDEIAKIVRLQTEVKLPLPADQIELSYRASALQDGHIAVIVAAARRQNLQRFVNAVKKAAPSKIILDYEAIVKIWSGFVSRSALPYGGRSEKDAVVVSIGQSSTKVCLVESGRLSNAATVDVGLGDFNSESESALAVKEMFVQDTRNVLGLFGIKKPGDVPIYLLSYGDGEDAEVNDESAIIKTIVSFMAQRGLNVKAADLDGRSAFGGFASNDNRQLYDYRIPIGLALMAMDGDETLGLFDSLYSPAGEKQKRPLLSSLRATLAAAGVLLAAAIFLFYLLDAATAGRLNALKEKMDYETLVEKQRLTEIIAGLRPDMLEMLSVLSSVNVNGVVIDGFDFKKGQPVKITGTVTNADQLYQFQEKLSEKKDIKDVKIQSAPEDEKTRRLKFTITFHYMNWTAKKAAG